MMSPAELAATKTRISEARQALASGHSAASDYRGLIDGLVGGLGGDAGWGGQGCALVALGGYGRGELAPRSDIDLLFLVGRHGRGQPPVESVLYPLWDLGFDVGHAVRTPAECAELAREDLTAATALLDSRLLLGETGLLADARSRCGIRPGGSRETRRWVSRIIDEVSGRREKFGEISHLLEPHVKEGKGGLRDFQASRWLLECAGGAPDSVPALPRGAEAAEAYEFLFRVRNALHAVAARKTDHLTFDFHRDVAAFLFPDDPIEKFFEAVHAAGHRISAFWDETVDASRESPGPSLPWRRRPAEPTDEELARELDQWGRAGGDVTPLTRRALARLGAEDAPRVLTRLAGRLLHARSPLAPLLHELHRLGTLG
ncbi:MAG: hypothetical protein HGA98_06180, partial [Deltaproteobacteria bacterium]|nr:hypothetical protein [Deltaproteobacteria bacterium]